MEIWEKEIEWQVGQCGGEVWGKKGEWQGG